MAFDAFISYASQDKPVADAVCARLEAAGIRCWIAPRDITPGMSYGEAIINAIHAARVMILVFSSHANASPQVPKEIERAVSNNVPIIPYRIENVTPGASLDYFIGSVHWLDALTPPMEQHLDSLVTTVRKLVPPRDGDDIPRPGPAPRPAAQSAPAQPAATLASASIPPQPSSRPNMAVIIGGILLAIVIAFGIYRFTSRPAGNPGPQDNTNDTQPAPDSNPPPSGNGNAAPAPAHKPAASATNANAISGCWLANGVAPYTVHANGTISSGPFTGHWRDLGGSKYTFTWPDMIETLTVSPDQRTMSGGNQYGFPITGGRVSGTTGLAGTWHWANNWIVNVSPNGTFTSGSWSGTWRVADAARGIYEMTWPKPVDQVLLTGGGARIQASNQYGVSSYSLRAGSCSE